MLDCFFTSKISACNSFSILLKETSSCHFCYAYCLSVFKAANTSFRLAFSIVDSAISGSSSSESDSSTLSRFLLPSAIDQCHPVRPPHRDLHPYQLFIRTLLLSFPLVSEHLLLVQHL